MRFRNVFHTSMVVLAVVIAPAAGIAEPQPAPNDGGQLKGQVAELIRDLDSDSRSTRTNARQMLLDLGPSILPHVPTPDELPNASVRETVREIRLELEKRLARASIQPSRVVVSEGMTLESFVSAVREQTGNDVDTTGIHGKLNQPVQLSSGEHSFWPAMDEVAKSLKLSYAAGSDARSLKLVPLLTPAPHSAPLVTYDGATRVSAGPAQLRPIFGDKTHKLLRVEIEILVEPRLRPLFLQYSLRDIKATGPGGRALESFNPNATYELAMGSGRNSVVARAEFRAPANVDLKKINLQGNLKLETAAGAETFVFQDLKEAQGKSRRRGGVVTTLRKVEIQPEAAQKFAANIGIGVAYETGGPAFESHRTWVFHNETWLEGKDGNRIEPEADFTTLLQGDGVIAIEYRFDRLTGDASEYNFVYVAPTLIISVPVKFELRQIPVKSTPAEGTRP